MVWRAGEDGRENENHGAVASNIGCVTTIFCDICEYTSQSHTPTPAGQNARNMPVPTGRRMGRCARTCRPTDMSLGRLQITQTADLIRWMPRRRFRLISSGGRLSGQFQSYSFIDFRSIWRCIRGVFIIIFGVHLGAVIFVFSFGCFTWVLFWPAGTRDTPRASARSARVERAIM